jgi:uncharacterized membrane protein YsdA (DUF1294 family)
VKHVIVKLLILYLLLINLAGFVSMGRDKRRAVTHRTRTPERRLLAYALAGGSAGCILGMLVFRHKTRHLKFALGLPAILVIQVLAAVAILIYIRLI